MRPERLGEADLVQALRPSGQGSLADVGAVVRETDGSPSVMGSATTSEAAALRDVAA